MKAFLRGLALVPRRATLRRHVMPNTHTTPSPTPASPAIDEAGARQVLLLQAHETGGPTPAWSDDDRTWATRLALDEQGPGSPQPERFVLARARHAAQRLRAREPSFGRWLEARPALRPWLLAALLLGLAAGGLADQIGPSQRINLLAPPVWLLVAWNGVVYALIAGQHLLPARGLARGARRLGALWAPRMPAGPVGLRLGLAWAQWSAPLNGARAALLLHVMAAALAVGLVAGLYLRGLVLDYRAGWQSTLLAPDTVQRVLATLLAPASAVTGIPLPDLAGITQLRVGPGDAAQGLAAPWLHLHAATLALFVVGPRLLLAAGAAWRVRRLQSRGTLPWHEPYFQALRRVATGRQHHLWVLPHGASLARGAQAALQSLTSAACGTGAQLSVGAAVAHGQEDERSACTPPPACTGVLVLVDLAATPEAEAQGRLLGSLAQTAAGLPLLLLADEAAFVRRFGHLPERLRERRQAWQALAAAHAVTLLPLDLSVSPWPEAALATMRQRFGA